MRQGQSDLDMFVQSIADELERIRNLIQASQRADYLDHTAYMRGQSVYVVFTTEGQGAVHGTVMGASVAGLILDHVATAQGLFYPGPVQIPWASIALLSTGPASLTCPWLEAAPED